MVLVLFAVLAVALQVANVFLCLALDQIFSPTVGALTFVILYFLNFAIAWIIAVKIAERWEAKAAVREKESWHGPALPSEH